MVKRLLVPLDPSPFTEAAVSAACRYAKRHKAELSGMVILDLPGIERSIGPVPLGASDYAAHLEEHKKREAENRIRSLLSSFRAACRQAGVKHRELEAQGAPSARIVAEAPYFDVVVMGLRTFFQFETQRDPGDTLDKVLDRCAVHVYGVPESGEPPERRGRPTRALIAFDGSLPSVMAMKRFIRWVPPGRIEARLLCSRDDEDGARQVLDRAGAYLKAHGVAAVRKTWTRTPILEAVDEALVRRSDVLVAGAHSSRGVLDFLVGSLTRRLIALALRPVFIGQ